jgi:nucleotide-binding universal stress UspA family protein
MTRVLACVDGSIYGQSVADHAVWAAAKLSASVDLLHTMGRRDVASVPVDLSGSLDLGERETLLNEIADLDAQKAKLAQKRGRLVLAQAAQRVRDAGVTAGAEILRHGDLIDTLKDFERTAELIVIGKRGEAADFAKLHLGSNLERVLRGSSKPVLVTSRAYRPIEHFLIAFDGGPSAVKAVDFIAKKPLLAGIACHLFTVGPNGGEMEDRMRAAETRLRRAGFEVTAGMEPGEPAAVIARKVEEAGVHLLVMGAYGHSRIRTLIIGSTTTETIRSCKVPVLLFR